MMSLKEWGRVVVSKSRHTGFCVTDRQIGSGELRLSQWAAVPVRWVIRLFSVRYEILGGGNLSWVIRNSWLASSQERSPCLAS